MRAVERGEHPTGIGTIALRVHDTRDASRSPTFERTLDSERFEAPLVHRTALVHLAAVAPAEAILANLDRT